MAGVFSGASEPRVVHNDAVRSALGTWGGALLPWETSVDTNKNDAAELQIIHPSTRKTACFNTLFFVCWDLQMRVTPEQAQSGFGPEIELSFQSVTRSGSTKVFCLRPENMALIPVCNAER